MNNEKQQCVDWEKEFDKEFQHSQECLRTRAHEGCTCDYSPIKSFISSLLQETSLDQYAMGQSEGIKYQEAKMKELREKVEKMKKRVASEDKQNVAANELRGYNWCVSDILNLLSSK